MVGFRGTVRIIVLATVCLVLGSALAGRASASSATPSVGQSLQNAAGITTEADHLSSRTLTVACSSSLGAWAQALTAVGFQASEADEYYGFSLIPEGVMHLSPFVCRGLAMGADATTREANTFQVAWSVDVLLHESTHMARFSYDEALVEACARVELPLELHRLYGLAYHSSEMDRLTLAAATFRRTQGPAYRGGSCPPVAAAGSPA